MKFNPALVAGYLFVRIYMLWKQVRALNARYDERQESLQKDYEEALRELQDMCSHESSAKWMYKIDLRGEVASTAEGILIKYRECPHCGLVEAKPDELNDYESEIPF